MKKIILILFVLSVLLISGCAQLSPRITPSPEVSRVSSPIPQNSEKICPAVCTPLWELKDNSCVLNNCGSGCGADKITTFETEAECKEKIRNPTSPPQGTAYPAKLEIPNFLKAAHFVDSFPKHGDTLTQPPQEVVVNFNFVIKSPTSATVLRNSVEIPTEIKITNEEYTLRVNLKGAKEDGVYTVKLNACWPDKSCHDGQLAFTVDSTKKASYKDFRGKAEVTVNMKDILFDAPNIVIDKGTKVTWANNDDAEHFINTDPHPTHNSLEPLNSKTLKKGDLYSYTFTQTGEFGYHCSAHADLMTGKIVVV